MPPTCDHCREDTTRVFRFDNAESTEWRCSRCHPDIEGLNYL